MPTPVYCFGQNRCCIITLTLSYEPYNISPSSSVYCYTPLKELLVALSRPVLSQKAVLSPTVGRDQKKNLRPMILIQNDFISKCPVGFVFNLELCFRQWRLAGLDEENTVECRSWFHGCPRPLWVFSPRATCVGNFRAINQGGDVSNAVELGQLSTV